jgi:hypothetical protein
MVPKNLDDALDKKCINTKSISGAHENMTIRSDGKDLGPLVVNRIKEKRLNFVIKVY